MLHVNEDINHCFSCQCHPAHITIYNIEQQLLILPRHTSNTSEPSGNPFESTAVLLFFSFSFYATVNDIQHASRFTHYTYRLHSIEEIDVFTIYFFLHMTYKTESNIEAISFLQIKIRIILLKNSASMINDKNLVNKLIVSSLNIDDKINDWRSMRKIAFF